MFASRGSKTEFHLIPSNLGQQSGQLLQPLLSLRVFFPAKRLENQKWCLVLAQVVV